MTLGLEFNQLKLASNEAFLKLKLATECDLTTSQSVANFVSFKSFQTSPFLLTSLLQPILYHPSPHLPIPSPGHPLHPSLSPVQTCKRILQKCYAKRVVDKVFQFSSPRVFFCKTQKFNLLARFGKFSTSSRLRVGSKSIACGGANEFQC
jgi:hypothetical protein